MSAGTDVTLDLPRMRQMSFGMTVYAEELAVRLPRVAPDLRFATVARDSALDLREQVALPLALRRTRPALVHHLSVYAPLLGPRPYVVTIHDLIHLRFPRMFKRSVGPYYRSVVRAVCAGAARVITDDERTVGDLERFLHVPPRKVAVVALGVDEAYRRDAPPAHAARPYVLYVGNRREHKDLATLFAAWERLDPALGCDLALTGEDDLAAWFLTRPFRARGTLRFLGEPRNAELASLYRGSAALVQPSLCEGFGLPMLEAAASGAPVVACADALPGVLRPYATTYPAGDAAALAAALGRVLATPAPTAAARDFARSLTWDACARRTAEVYRSVLAQGPRR